MDAFNCVIYGHIEMTRKEWLGVIGYLRRSGGDLLEKRILREDIFRTDMHLGASWRNIRVTYTEKLFKHFNLPRYKRQNYAIKIV